MTKTYRCSECGAIAVLCDPASGLYCPAHGSSTVLTAEESGGEGEGWCKTEEEWAREVITQAAGNLMADVDEKPTIDWINAGWDLVATAGNPEAKAEEILGEGPAWELFLEVAESWSW